MIYYFSGTSYQNMKREMNVDQLFSIHHEKKAVIDTIKYKHEHPEYTANIMLDSGAFSHFQELKKQGKEMTPEDLLAYTDDYIEFLNEYGDDITVFVGVDSVPDPNHVDPSYAQKTWDNYLYMYSKLKPEIRDKLIPVFHYGEDFKWLTNMLEYKHEDGSPIDYIGLAISLEGTTKLRIQWANMCRMIIENSSNPNVKTHAFGVGVKAVLEHINVTSTDATSWVKRAAYGMIAIDDKQVFVSDYQRDHVTTKYYEQSNSAEYKRLVDAKISERGFTNEEIATKSECRAKFNIMDTLDWLKTLPDNTNKKYTSIVRGDLW